MALRDYREWFKLRDDAQDGVALANARECPDWMGQSYYARFVGWLDEEASKPFNTRAGQMDLIESAVRANVFREVKRHLDRLRVESEAAIRQAQEGNDE